MNAKIKGTGEIIALCFTLAVVSELLYRGWKLYRSKTSATPRKCRPVHEVIMFHPHENGSSLTRSKFSRCLISPQLDRVMFHLASTRHSIDCAVYVLTSMDLANILISLARSGVTVRCIVDADMAYSSGSQVRRLEKNGASVRWKKSTNLMHHKFCIMDSNTDDNNVTPKILTGSLNWTSQALSGNWENVVVTSQHNLVELYKAEFERLWNEFKVTLDTLQQTL